MASVFFSSGSPTCTLWKRRSSAASFSMNLRYSASVVAPMTRISPRPRAGFRIFAASTAPSALPAPTMVCSSSMKRITLPSRRTSSSRTRMRSSNSPRYFVPATMPDRSSSKMRLSTSSSGTSPAAILSARPSAMAVLPTPGSPMSTGLFFVRRVKMRSARAISSSRPITGSSLPSRAIAVKSRVNSASVLPLLPSLRLARTSGSGALRGEALIAHSVSLYSFRVSTPERRSKRPAVFVLSRRIPSSKCPASITPLPARAASPTASSTALRA